MTDPVPQLPPMLLDADGVRLLGSASCPNCGDKFAVAVSEKPDDALVEALYAHFLEAHPGERLGEGTTVTAP